LGGEKPVDYFMAIGDNIDNVKYDKLQKKLVKAVGWYVQVRGLEAKVQF
jgi:hypothetical protein